MILQVPVSVHLDLYRYWDSKRARPAIPARRDIDPAEMRHLLPHLSLVEATIEGGFRYRLVGTRVVQDLGRDVTGTPVGARVKPPAYAASLNAIYARVTAERRPLFVSGSYRGPGGITHAISRLLLPLGEPAMPANMVILSRVTRHSTAVQVSSDWLGRGVGTTEREDWVGSAAELEALTAEWERRCAG